MIGLVILAAAALSAGCAFIDRVSAPCTTVECRLERLEPEAQQREFHEQAQREARRTCQLTHGSSPILCY
jgi:hypothetical protein